MVKSSKYKTFSCNLDGVIFAIIYTKTKSAAAKAFGISLHHFNNYGHETFNEEQVTKSKEVPDQALFYMDPYANRGAIKYFNSYNEARLYKYKLKYG